MPDRHQRIRCKARSKNTGKQCRCWAMNGSRVCRVHGAKGGRPPVTGRYSKIERRHRILHGQRMAISLDTLDHIVRVIHGMLHEFVPADKRDAAIKFIAERLRGIPMPVS